MVASPNFRHPVPFAKELMTLDDISGGRLVATGPPREIATRELIAEHYNARVEVIGEAGEPVAVIPVRHRRPS